MRVRGSVYESSAQSLARSQQIQQDTLKREQEARSTAASLRSKFHASCQEMGIQVGSSPPISCSWVFCLHLQGEGVREELQDLLSELPGIFQQTLDGLQSLSPALSYYQTVVETNTGRFVYHPRESVSWNSCAGQWTLPPSCRCCTTS